MGLFDKFKKNAAAPAEPEAPAVKEDFSGLSVMDLLEKADQYTNEFQASITKANYLKLEAVLNEIATRGNTVPLAQRSGFNAYNMSYKSYLTTFKQALTTGSTQLFDIQINTAKSLYSSLAFALNQT